MSFIFTPGVNDSAPIEIDSIGGGKSIFMSGSLLLIQFFINGI